MMPSSARQIRRWPSSRVLVSPARSSSVVVLGLASSASPGRRWPSMAAEPSKSGVAAQTAVDHAASAAALRWVRRAQLGHVQRQDNSLRSATALTMTLSTVVVTITNRAESDPTTRSARRSPRQINGTFSRIIGMNTSTIGVEDNGRWNGLRGNSCKARRPAPSSAVGKTCTGGKFGVDISGSERRRLRRYSLQLRRHRRRDLERLRRSGAGPRSVDVHRIDDAGQRHRVSDRRPTRSTLGRSCSTPQRPAGWVPADVASAGNLPPAGSLLRADDDLADANGSNDMDSTHSSLTRRPRSRRMASTTHRRPTAWVSASPAACERSCSWRRTDRSRSPGTASELDRDPPMPRLTPCLERVMARTWP